MLKIPDLPADDCRNILLLYSELVLFNDRLPMTPEHLFREIKSGAAFYDGYRLGSRWDPHSKLQFGRGPDDTLLVDFYENFDPRERRADNKYYTAAQEAGERFSRAANNLPQDSTLTQRAFVRDAIVDAMDKNGSGNWHKGIDPDTLEAPFRERFQQSSTATVNALIQDEQVVLVHLIYSGQGRHLHGSRFVGVGFLDALPAADRNIPGRLRLYLSKHLPVRVAQRKRRLERERRRSRRSASV